MYGNQLDSESNSLAKSFIAFLLIVLCLVAANWQFHRGQDRHQLNDKIVKNLAKPSLNALPKNIAENEWRRIEISGKYLSGTDLLRRNSYFEGQYGYEYLTKFRATTGEIIWIDRGWVKAGATASEKPLLPRTPKEEVLIEGRIRSGKTLLQGKFFALRQKVPNDSDTKFTIDLIKTNGRNVDYPADLPALSDGPHYAYTLQWLFFGGLVIYGRLLIRRQALSGK